MDLINTLLGLLLLAVAGCQTNPSGGRWQPGSTSAASVRLAPAPDSHWLITNTGGGEGQRGEDLRHRLFDVHFWDEKIGWTCGMGGAFRTADGGLTWTRMKPPGGWVRVEMSGPAEIWLFDLGDGQTGHLWHTTDDGATWIEILPGQLRACGEYCGDLYCRGDQRWFLGGDKPSYRSRDGGQSWTAEQFGGLLQGAWKIAIPDASGPTVYVLGHQGGQRRLIRSGDSGATWSRLPVPPGSCCYGGVMFFATELSGWIGGDAGGILFTPDGGTTWQPRGIATDQPISALWFDAAGHGFAGVINLSQERHRNALYETFDRGQSWTPVLAGAKHVDAFSSVGPGKLWGVGMSTGQWITDLVIIHQ